MALVVEITVLGRNSEDGGAVVCQPRWTLMDEIQSDLIPVSDQSLIVGIIARERAK